MSHEHLTIFFDTNFFIMLAQATDEEAEEVIHALNQHHVRHVVSMTTMKELLGQTNKPDNDLTLYTRITRLNIEPLKSNAYLAWEAILSTGDLRSNIASETLSRDAEMALAASLGQVGRSGKAEDHYPGIVNHFGHLWPDTVDTKDPKSVAEAALNSLTPFLTELGINTQLPEQPAEEDYLALSQRVLDYLGDDVVADCQLANNLQDAATKDDQRVHQVATGQKAPKTLLNSHRDANRMKEFIDHQDQIDYLQLDRAQFNLLAKQPEHPLKKAGLETRCFRLSALTDIISFLSTSVRL